MDKYKIDDKIVPKKGKKRWCSFAEGVIIAFTSDEGAVIRVTREGNARHHQSGQLCLKRPDTLDALYDIVPPEALFFEVGKFYRWPMSHPACRYEIKEIFEVEQPGGNVRLYAHAERVDAHTVALVMLSEGNFDAMVKM